ncbi:hypothetical protein MPS_3648 [Mycobacterium pseudoshottsii JCM 15466]|nr:hypothetical protein MPS_3648 [Mycobacterium pseudoshottsii JCM 15466]
MPREDERLITDQFDDDPSEALNRGFRGVGQWLTAGETGQGYGRDGSHSPEF